MSLLARSWVVIAIWVLTASSLLGQSSQENSLQELYRRAQEAIAEKRYDEAAGEFRRIIELSPELAEARANLGVIYYLQGKYSLASKEFRAALRIKPSLAKAENFLGLSEARSGRVADALPLLEKSFQRPADDEWRQQTGLLLVELYYGMQEFDKALDTVRTLQKSYPGDPEVLYFAYRIYSELGAKAVSGLARLAPGSARLHQVTAELLESEGDFPRALEQYRKALEKDPKLPGIHRALGVTLLNIGQDESSLAEAQKHFEAELAANPADAHSEYQLGEIYWSKYQYEQALKHFIRAVELRPNFVDALIALGKAMTSQGESEKAVEYLREAARIDPENEVAHYRLAQAYRDLGRSELADEEMAKFRKLREQSSSIGVIYRQVQRTPVIGQKIEAVEEAK